MEVPEQLSRSLRAAYSTVAGDDLRDFIAAVYRVEPAFTCNLLKRGFNDVYLLRFRDDRQAIARLGSRRARGPNNVDYETALLSHLKSLGANVAAPWRTHIGETSVEANAADGSRSLVVFDFLEGEPPGLVLQDIRTMGTTLAELHDLARSYTGPVSRYVLDLDHLIRRPLQRLLMHPSTDETLRKRLETSATNLIAKIEKLGTSAGLTNVACHGDCHGGNTVMRSNAAGAPIASFFDFDDGGPGYLAYDLAVYLWSILLNSKEATPSADECERWQHFIDGYRERSPVPPNDYAAIALFVCARHFWFLGEYASRRDEWGTAALPRWWLKNQADRLAQWSTLETPGATSR